MRGIGHAAVVFHRKCPITTQMQPDRLARRVKNAGMKFLKLMENEKNIVLGEKLYCMQIIKAIGKSAGIIYE
jgi:hypothetical protein